MNVGNSLENTDIGLRKRLWKTGRKKTPETHSIALELTSGSNYGWKKTPETQPIALTLV